MQAFYKKNNWKHNYFAIHNFWKQLCYSKSHGESQIVTLPNAEVVLLWLAQPLNSN